VSFASITLWVAPQRMFIAVYFVIDAVQKLLDTPCPFAVGYVRLQSHVIIIIIIIITSSCYLPNCDFRLFSGHTIKRRQRKEEEEEEEEVLR
jgi:hypothetical protein